jgi:hypothetical protein
MGGFFVGQEVLKVTTGKFTPINQWLYFEHIGVLPNPLPWVSLLLSIIIYHYL